MDKLLNCRINEVEIFACNSYYNVGAECLLTSDSHFWNFYKYKIDDIEVVKASLTYPNSSYGVHVYISIIYRNTTLILCKKMNFIGVKNELYIIKESVDMYKCTNIPIIIKEFDEITYYENTMVGDYFRSSVKSARK